MLKHNTYKPIGVLVSGTGEASVSMAPEFEMSQFVSIRDSWQDWQPWKFSAKTNHRYALEKLQAEIRYY